MKKCRGLDNISMMMQQSLKRSALQKEARLGPQISVQIVRNLLHDQEEIIGNTIPLLQEVNDLRTNVIYILSSGRIFMEEEEPIDIVTSAVNIQNRTTKASKHYWLDEKIRIIFGQIMVEGRQKYDWYGGHQYNFIEGI